MIGLFLHLRGLVLRESELYLKGKSVSSQLCKTSLECFGWGLLPLPSDSLGQTVVDYRALQPLF